MTDEEKRILNERAFTCPHCKGRLPDWMRGACHGKYFNKKLNTFRSKYFCTEECYEDYKKDFVVEIYNDTPIYCIEINGEKRYMPYFEAAYYFTNIDNCKKRMSRYKCAWITTKRQILNGENYGFE
jgi:hypothetical protein